MYCIYKIVIFVIIIICILLSRLILYCAYYYINGNFYIHCGASLEYGVIEYEYEQLKQLRATRFVDFVHTILTCICLRDGGTICQGRVTFLNAPLRKRQFYNSIKTHQYKRFIHHQHESYKLGGYYTHPLLLIDAHPPLGINETSKTYT